MVGKQNKIAIYSRKSRMTEQGESIQNQIEFCKQYARQNFNACDSDFVLFQDEGFSGGNTSRPAFTRMMSKFSENEFRVLICYRLDRISRSVVDFSSVLNELTKRNIAFVSVTEHFDTSAPMGRAMMYIASVFAQLERETIAERIKDNLRQLARTGRYLGSSPPIGFRSEKITYTDNFGNKKKMNKLAPILDEIEYVKILFRKFEELKGLSKLETTLMRMGLKNKNGNFPGTTELRRILSNPVYVKADERIYDYYAKLGSEVVNTRESFDGQHGLLLYGRHDRNNGVYDPTKWMVVIAYHEGIIAPGKWLEAQHIMDENKKKAPRAGQSRTALLTSKIRCGHCGGTMVIIYGTDKSTHYYKCRNKIKSRKAICDIKNIKGEAADNEIFYHLKSFVLNKPLAIEIMAKQRNDYLYSRSALDCEEMAITKEMQVKETEIKNLVAQLKENRNSVAAKYIVEEMEHMDTDIQKLKSRLLEIDDEKYKSNEVKEVETQMLGSFVSFGTMADYLSLTEKRKYIDDIINEVIWDGSNMTISFRV